MWNSLVNLRIRITNKSVGDARKANSLFFMKFASLKKLYGMTFIEYNLEKP